MSNGKNRELVKKYYTIYKITNLVNDKIYIGFHSTNNIEDGYLGSGKAIKRAIEKYGEENFYKEILEIFDNKEDAEQCEAELVNEEFVNRSDTYNITVGGNVCILGGENNGFYGKTHTEETIEQMQKTGSGYTFIEHTEETKKKISRSLKKYHSNPEVKKKLKEKIIPEETRIKISKANKGKVVSEETKKKSSISKKKRFKNMTEEEYGEGYNKIFTEERRKKLSDSQKGRKCPWVKKTNKDPEKIRKTAETHRGMKRSDQAKKNISEAMKGKPALNKGFIGCYNPITNERKMIDGENNIPDGGVKGMGKKKSTPKDKIYCHDPETNERKMCYPQNIPEGGIRGMGKKKGSK